MPFLNILCSRFWLQCLPKRIRYEKDYFGRNMEKDRDCTRLLQFGQYVLPRRTAVIQVQPALLSGGVHAKGHVGFLVVIPVSCRCLLTLFVPFCALIS